MGVGPIAVSLYVAEVSDRQWRDIVGILLVQEEALDRDSLQRGAAKLGVVDLLTRAVVHAKP
jgi:hypothetical protein